MSFKWAIKYSWISTLILASCSKNVRTGESFTKNVSGKLVSVEDNSKIAYGSIMLLSSERKDLGSAMWYGYSYKVNSTVITDHEGNYSFKFNAHRDSIYELAAVADGYFSSYNLGGGFKKPQWAAQASGQIRLGLISDNIIIRLVPKGWINVSFSKAQPLSETRYVHLYTFKTLGREYIYGGQGQKDTTVLFGPSMAGTNVHIEYKINTNGNLGPLILDSVYLAAHDTLEYHIDF